MVGTITSALWYVHPHFKTIEDASQSKLVPSLPDRWPSVFGSQLYFDWKAKKEKHPRIDVISVGLHSRALTALLDKPCISGHLWSEVQTDIEGLVESLTGYQPYLENSREKQTERQRLPHPVRQVSDAITVTYHSPGALAGLSVDEKNLHDRIGSEGAYIPVTFSEEDILGKSFSNSKRHRFLKSFEDSTSLGRSEV